MRTMSIAIGLLSALGGAAFAAEPAKMIDTKLGKALADEKGMILDLAPKFHPVLSSLRRFWVVVFAAVAACCGAEPFRLRSTASRRALIV